MYSAFGIVNSSPRNILVEGLQDFRPIGAFSFLGRYRVIDFPISNLSNSDIDRIQVYMDNNKPRSLIEHLALVVTTTSTPKAVICSFFFQVPDPGEMYIIQILQLILRIWRALRRCITLT